MVWNIEGADGSGFSTGRRSNEIMTFRNMDSTRYVHGVHRDDEGFFGPWEREIQSMVLDLIGHLIVEGGRHRVLNLGGSSDLELDLEGCQKPRI
ncbi:hypothetical protein CDL15_Pgr027291 [Punica granatum]|uniref:Uncharacterized protein n=1 Tax=Punica granatum TaxID=22663 RepID=A0A218XRP4_PUNGR|nr:hypothetical protein CDL15_Pgr027291 [Punica granatum]